MQKVEPLSIEKRSFELIEEGLGERVLDPVLAPVIKRVIHTTADFEFADLLYFSENVVDRAICAIKQGAHIMTDTNMAAAGINKKTLASFGGEVHCFMAEEEVAKRAKELGTTRAAVCVEKALYDPRIKIFVLGNAPTALLELCEKIEQGFIPDLVVGAPVGFVNVVESKERLMALNVPQIVVKGRKGGSNVAAAIVNALVYMANGENRK